MSFQDAIRSVLGQYAGFSGRARRSEYWYWILAYTIAYVVAVVVDGVLGFPLLTVVVILGAIVPTIAVSVRRLHDIGKPGVMFLLYLIPLVGFILTIVWGVPDSGPDNQYGPDPKRVAAS